MTDARKLKTFRVAVFMSVSAHSGRDCWDAYTLCFSTTWPSYVGTFIVAAEDGPKAKRLAIQYAKANGLRPEPQIAQNVHRVFEVGDAKWGNANGDSP